MGAWRELAVQMSFFFFSFPVAKKCLKEAVKHKSVVLLTI